ncbi:hypothetical protein CF70_013070 [Cupriavidus sp. SK-3]|uniref:hypothetical protein n=1 Tax=Cupriavidus sp. SK-3 TaxID=1470558 RepID=UPI000446B96C|nr:hypothetical protein [Cupriavidus sp. SK-3]KDP85622.1 hypothetical protein CF70_013070 [Cupriavidus sp. SK-3]
MKPAIVTLQIFKQLHADGRFGTVDVTNGRRLLATFWYQGPEAGTYDRDRYITMEEAERQAAEFVFAWQKRG